MEVKDLYYFAKVEQTKRQKEDYSKKNLSPEQGAAVWNSNEWWLFCSDKLVEHVIGEACWAQFDISTFGTLRTDNGRREKLLALHCDVRRRAEAQEDKRDPKLREELFTEFNRILAY